MTLPAVRSGRFSRRDLLAAAAALPLTGVAAEAVAQSLAMLEEAFA